MEGAFSARVLCVPAHTRMVHRTTSHHALCLRLIPRPHPRHGHCPYPVSPFVATRKVSPGVPRDRPIALIAPAAAALCLALSRTDCSESGSGSGSRVRATLYAVLSDCMRGAVDLMAMVLDGANRLGHAVKPERFGAICSLGDV